MTDERGPDNGIVSEPEPTRVEPVPPPPTAPPPPRRRLGAAVTWGMVLVLLGLLLLVDQFVPGVAVWRLWPVIVIALGVRSMIGGRPPRFRLQRVADGLVIVAIGLILLGQTLGYLSWAAWFNIFRLWPVLLVSLGLEIVGRGLHAQWPKLIGTLLVIAALAYGALVMSPTGSLSFAPLGDAEPFAFERAHDATVEDGSARIDAGVGQFSIEGGDDLATADGASSATPRFDVTTDGATADVVIGGGGTTWIPADGVELDITLDREVVWDLRLNAGVSAYVVDLSEVPVSALAFNAGVSDGTLTLGRASLAGRDGRVRARIESGVSSITVRVPRSDDVRVSVSEGLADVNVKGAWDRTSDRRVWESDGFSDAGTYWDIEVTAGIGSITVEYY